jgi:hypothetical protein
MALPLAAMMLFAQSQTTQTPSTRPDQSSSSQTDRSAQPGQTDRSTQPGQTDRSTQPGQRDRSGQADRPGQSSTQSGAQSGQPDRSTTQSGARPGQSSSTQSSTTQADRASSASMTFTGTIVNADCTQAQALIDRTSGSYADRDSASTSSTKTEAGATAQSGAASTSQSGAGQTASTTARNQKSVYDLQRDVMRRCAASAKTENLALLTDDGRFLKLDNAGSTQVKTEAGKNIKNMKVTINGSLEGDTLRVQSVTKKTGA